MVKNFDLLATSKTDSNKFFFRKFICKIKGAIFAKVKLNSEFPIAHAKKEKVFE
jgi:hypothetical protein